MKSLINKVNCDKNFLPLTITQPISEDLKLKGYVVVHAEIFQKILDIELIQTKEIENFIDSWNYLEMDNFMSDKGNYRKRKHATFTIENHHYKKNAYIPHYQTVDYNNLNGGVKRYFTEIDDKTTENKCFNYLLSFANNRFDNSRYLKWFVEAHQFRIEASQSMAGKPTPEGIHRDGVDFVLMAMINRQNMLGGITTIFDLNQNELTNFELKDFMDVAVLDDHRVFHGVSEITPTPNSNISFRDVLVITFKEIKE